MRTLIIKTGAAGDVARTTALLNVIEGEIWWITSERNGLLLPVMENLQVHSPGSFSELKNIPFFDFVISLEEDPECATLASTVKAAQLSGVYHNNGTICYTEDSSSWFDMSRISKLGVQRANELKMANRATHQDHMFRIIGRKFMGEKYMLRKPADGERRNNIGIETRSGDRWPNKRWGGYAELIKKLESEGREVTVFTQRNNLADYLSDINECAFIISGDTLAMHLALANEKNCTAIFNCTSPDEIFDYGLLSKVVSPLLMQNFYSTSFDEKVVNSVPVEAVYQTIRN